MRGLVAAILAAGLAAGCGNAVPAPVATPTTSPAAPRPALTGHAPIRAFSVAVRRDQSTGTVVYYPRQAGRYPIVIFGHGLSSLPESYADLLRTWAAAGFVVAAPTFPYTSRGAQNFNPFAVTEQPRYVGAVLDRLLALPTTDEVGRSLDRDRIAVAGHSAGGITALGVFTTAERDPRFDAGIVLAGNSFGVGEGFNGPSSPILFVHADADPVVPYWTGRSAYTAVPWPKAFLTLTGEDHVRAYAGRTAKQFTLVARATTEFLRWSLYDDAPARTRLAAMPGLENGL